MNETHYKAAAEQVRQFIWKAVKREICHQFTIFFAKHSSEFNPKQFVTDCGLDWDSMVALQIELRIK